jgi:hypothetical protein
VSLPPAKPPSLRTLGPYQVPSTAGQVPAVLTRASLLVTGKAVRRRNGFA